MDYLLLASDLDRKGARAAVALGPRAAACMHTGCGPSLNQKLWPCEDSAALHRLSEGELLACVADAHWGGAASEAVARELRPAFERAPASLGPCERLLAALVEVERGYLAAAAPDEVSETTALAVYLAGERAAFASVGDSFLLHLGRRELWQRNRLGAEFLGRRSLPATPGAVQTGEFRVMRGEVLLLATDGLEPRASGLAWEESARFLRGPGPLAGRLEALLARAAADGRDNLALVALEAG
ncbi:MAG: hypothetical protein D6731_19025 [Planctomycetota bacterium]|nr:MAG: hypothetical protein D6731_19025 [Planctomycetota bacterium]